MSSNQYNGAYTLNSNGTLKNGATLIEQRGDIVLAKTDGYHPYVTWTMDRDGNCYWGHYHATIGEAVAEFNERSGK